MGRDTSVGDGARPVVHLASEYWPFARTGGLAEAVRGIATSQARSGRRTAAVLPLYGTIRANFPDFEPDGEAFELKIGGRSERARVHRFPSCDGPDVYLVEHDGYFGRPQLYGELGQSYPDNHRRFAHFTRVALAALPRISPGPLILHAHDWHTALAPVYLRTLLQDEPAYRDIATVLTVHNAGFQGHYAGSGVLDEVGLPESLYNHHQMEWYGQTNLLKGGLVFSDVVTTVSPTHAHELRTRTGGFGLHDAFCELGDRFVGILNGIDYAVWDPETDAAIHAPFSSSELDGKARCKAWLQEACGLEARPEVPLFGMSARMVEQKGLDIILGAEMIPRLDAQWIFLGHGEPRYESALAALAEAAPGRVVTRFDFTEEREHQLMAGADFLLMPSLYEPCGLTQMRAQRYGALPVVRRVGGLSDTVEDRVTGFVFDEYQPWALEEAVRFAIELYADRTAWREHVREAMARDFSWNASVTRYDEAYRQAVEHRGSVS